MTFILFTFELPLEPSWLATQKPHDGFHYAELFAEIDNGEYFDSILRRDS